MISNEIPWPLVNQPSNPADPPSLEMLQSIANLWVNFPSHQGLVLLVYACLWWMVDDGRAILTLIV